eukprot:11194350-Lingulodinium_polyedra.AAC.1
MVRIRHGTVSAWPVVLGAISWRDAVWQRAAHWRAADSNNEAKYVRSYLLACLSLAPRLVAHTAA